MVPNTKPQQQYVIENSQETALNCVLSACAIDLALNIISINTNRKFIIFSDSSSILIALKTKHLITH